MARPTKYNAELLEIAKDYLINYEELGDVVPTVAGLACELQINKDTIYDWIKHEDKHEFSVTVKEIAHIQERKLVSGGLSGAMNSMITKLLLNNHGYSEKHVVDNKSSDGSMSPKGFNDFYGADEPEESEDL
tara:strand:+ start:3381 stop:3776 length:396 start_codon:yes stop_codon:yes gene_type:complete